MHSQLFAFLRIQFIFFYYVTEEQETGYPFNIKTVWKCCVKLGSSSQFFKYMT